MQTSETKDLKKSEITSLETEARIIARYREESKSSDRKPSAIMLDIAAEERYSLEGVRKLLIRNGAYTPVKRKEAEDDSQRDS